MRGNAIYEVPHLSERSEDRRSQHAVLQRSLPADRSGQLGFGEIRDLDAGAHHARSRRGRLIARLIATWFGCGYSPVGPGTAGSIAAIAIAWAVHYFTGLPGTAFGFFAALLAIPGVWAADVVARKSGNKDPQIVVVDEVVGQWVTLAGAAALNWKSWLIALALFRLFDIW